MGKERHKKEIESLFARSPVVGFSSLVKIIRGRKKAGSYAKVLVHNLAAKGRIRRLSKGCYTAFDNADLAVFCFQPAYLGLQDALSFHDLWEQETIPIIITARKARPGIRRILGKNVLIRRINAKYFFGIEYSSGEKTALPYSDMEKTFIDMVYFRENMTKEVITAFRKRIDRKKLRAYLKAYPQGIRKTALSLIK